MGAAGRAFVERQADGRFHAEGFGQGRSRQRKARAGFRFRPGQGALRRRHAGPHQRRGPRNAARRQLRCDGKLRRDRRYRADEGQGHAADAEVRSGAGGIRGPCARHGPQRRETAADGADRVGSAPAVRDRNHRWRWRGRFCDPPSTWRGRAGRCDRVFGRWQVREGRRSRPQRRLLDFELDAARQGRRQGAQFRRPDDARALHCRVELD